MFELVKCPACLKSTMLDNECETGFCLYCGAHIAYADAIDEKKEQDENDAASEAMNEDRIEVDCCELIAEDGFEDDGYLIEESGRELTKADGFMSQLDFVNAYSCYEKALEIYPKSFDAVCGLMMSGVMRLTDVENWGKRLNDVVKAIRCRDNWTRAENALEYCFDILGKFFSKGDRYVVPYLTTDFFGTVFEKFPKLIEKAMKIYAHCINVSCCPTVNCARLDNGVNRYTIGNFNAALDRDYRFQAVLVLKYYSDRRIKDQLLRCVYVFDRFIWLKNKDERICDVIEFLDMSQNGDFEETDKLIAKKVCYDFLMMGALEQNMSEREKLTLLSRVYTWERIQRMEKHFSESLFFQRLKAQVFLLTKGNSIISPEYKRIQARINELKDDMDADAFYGRKIKLF